MSHIAVLGLGNFGTAITRLWGDAGHHIQAWTATQEVFDSIRNKGTNEKYLPGIPLQAVVTMDLGQAVSSADIVVLALPTSVVLELVDNVIPFLKSEQIILDLAKGLGPDDSLVSKSIKTKLKDAGLNNPLCVLTGPTIATELASGVFTTALVASSDEAAAKRIVRELSTTTFKLSPTDDPLGAEYWGAFKNVIALACGVSDGLKDGGFGGDNLKAAIFTAGYQEAVRLLPELGASPKTALSSAAVGDLYVTATSPFGRNRQMGERLGRGQTLEQARNEMVMVSEGVRAARMFQRLYRNSGQSAPFVDAVCALLDGEISAIELVDSVLGGL